MNRLREYNAGPKMGDRLAAENKFWLHAFRLVYFTIAEMQLRNARRADLRVKQDQLVAAPPNNWRGLSALRRSIEVLEGMVSPNELYRGFCVDVEAGTPNPFSLNFYKAGRVVRYDGFTSSSADRETSMGFARCDPHVPGVRAALLLKLKRKDDDPAPCFLDATLSAIPGEAEHLFPPHSHFKVTKRGPCPKRGAVTCVEMEYVKSAMAGLLGAVAAV